MAEARNAQQTIVERPQLLILDDEPDIRDTLVQTLSDGYLCHTAGDVTQASKVLQQRPISLALCDVNLPGESGLDFLRFARNNYPDLAVTMVTALDRTEVAVEALKEGAYDYIIKPFNLDEVRLSVKNVLERRRLEIENRDYQLHLEEKVAEQTEAIRDLYLGAFRALAVALEAKDPYTNGHSERVAGMSVRLARAFYSEEEELARMRLSGLLHDIGKIGVREEILNKGTNLTPEEYEHVKTHVIVGEEILRPILTDNDGMRLVVRHHHERYDGKGFPDALVGENVPLDARILAVADAYDAMTSPRPYRKARTTEEAIQEIARGRGTQFDPRVVEEFLALQQTD